MPNVDDAAQLANNDSLFHYTDASGLLGILESATLRATDVRCMNDAREVEYASSIVGDVFRNLGQRAAEMGGLDIDPPSGAAEFVAWSEEFKRAGVKEGNLPHEVGITGQFFSIASQYYTLADRSYGLGHHDAYAACLTTLPDSLGQWRGYAGGSGYAIEFDTEYLSQSTVDIEGQGVAIGGPRKVVYGEQDASLQAAELLQKLSAGLNKEIEAVEVGQPVNADAVWALSDPNLEWLATIKHEAFREELEWRFVVASDRYANGLVPELRAGGVSGIVPFVPLSFGRHAVRSVVVGPGPETDLRMMMTKKALSRFGYHGVPVTSSNAPYRP